MCDVIGIVILLEYYRDERLLVFSQLARPDTIQIPSQVTLQYSLAEENSLSLEAHEA